MKFINADCMKYLPDFADNHFDLAIVDPPYGIGAGNYKRGGTQHGKSKAICNTYTVKKWDDNRPTGEYFKWLFRISKNQIIWGGNYYALQGSPCYIVWDKDNSDNNYADCELAWTSFDTAVRKFTHKWHGMLQQDMKNKEIRIHPTQKPVQLYRWLLKNYAKPGDLILDTHVGSGSSLVACIMEEFDYIGYEIDKEYYDGAIKRIKTEKQKLKLL